MLHNCNAIVKKLIRKRDETILFRNADAVFKFTPICRKLKKKFYSVVAVVYDDVTKRDEKN